MRKTYWALLIVVFIGAFLSACLGQAPLETPIVSTPTLDGTLRPYPSETATPSPLPTDYVSPTPSPTLTLSPTPVYYEVMLGDDMYSIAFRYNLSPEAIMTANPTVNPRAMTVGTMLLIPITPVPESPEGTTPTSTPELSPTPTARYETLRSPDCYQDALGGLWCFVLVENREEGALENVSGLVTLNPEGQAEVRQEVAIMPLNLLPPGKSLPLVAYFQPPLPEAYTVSAQVDFLLPVMPDDQRYLPIHISDQAVDFGEAGGWATVTGTLSLPEGVSPAQYVWLSATGLDAEGHVVAVRRWSLQEGLEPGADIRFEIELYSLGGAIETVELVAEAQPYPEPVESP
jgi:LysM repeat protein